MGEPKRLKVDVLGLCVLSPPSCWDLNSLLKPNAKPTWLHHRAVLLRTVSFSQQQLALYQFIRLEQGLPSYMQFKAEAIPLI